MLLEDVRQYCIWETSRLFRADGSAAAGLGGPARASDGSYGVHGRGREFEEVWNGL